jgi:hypothetical protein
MSTHALNLALTPNPSPTERERGTAKRHQDAPGVKSAMLTLPNPCNAAFASCNGVSGVSGGRLKYEMANPGLGGQNR